MTAHTCTKHEPGSLGCHRHPLPPTEHVHLPTPDCEWYSEAPSGRLVEQLERLKARREHLRKEIE